MLSAFKKEQFIENLSLLIAYRTNADRIPILLQIASKLKHKEEHLLLNGMYSYLNTFELCWPGTGKIQEIIPLLKSNENCIPVFAEILNNFTDLIVDDNSRLIRTGDHRMKLIHSEILNQLRNSSSCITSEQLLANVHWRLLKDGYSIDDAFQNEYALKSSINLRDCYNTLNRLKNICAPNDCISLYCIKNIFSKDDESLTTLHKAWDLLEQVKIKNSIIWQMLAAQPDALLVAQEIKTLFDCLEYVDSEVKNQLREEIAELKLMEQDPKISRSALLNSHNLFKFRVLRYCQSKNHIIDHILRLCEAKQDIAKISDAISTDIATFYNSMSAINAVELLDADYCAFKSSPKASEPAQVARVVLLLSIAAYAAIILHLVWISLACVILAAIDSYLSHNGCEKNTSSTNFSVGQSESMHLFSPHVSLNI